MMSPLLSASTESSKKKKKDSGEREVRETWWSINRRYYDVYDFSCVHCTLHVCAGGRANTETPVLPADPTPHTCNTHNLWEAAARIQPPVRNPNPELSRHWSDLCVCGVKLRLQVFVLCPQPARSITVCEGLLHSERTELMSGLTFRGSESTGHPTERGRQQVDVTSSSLSASPFCIFFFLWRINSNKTSTYNLFTWRHQSLNHRPHQSDKSVSSGSDDQLLRPQVCPAVSGEGLQRNLSMRCLC